LQVIAAELPPSGKKGEFRAMKANPVTHRAVVAILHWKGQSQLATLLPTVETAISTFSGECHALLLDNGAGTGRGTKAWLRNNFPGVEYIAAPKNDFLYSYNWLAENRNEDVVILLNDDVRVATNFIEPLLIHFQDDDVFAVGATSRDWEDTRFTSGPVRLRSHHGIYYWDFERQRQQLCHTLFCSGGFMAVDREKFLELRGFNRLFEPAYGEDVDLCFRAWKRGWRCIFEPTSVVYHRESSSFTKAGADRPTQLMRRAQLLFQWASLPPTGGWLRRAAMRMLLWWRHWRAGDRGWVDVWLRTWLEWRRVRMRYRWMKTSKEELANLQRRIEMPVASAAFENKCRE
jgi:N-acetylglucosaminyl-diphospho-decaprenol L-rhamnosyltransferase